MVKRKTILDQVRAADYEERTRKLDVDLIRARAAAKLADQARRHALVEAAELRSLLGAAVDARSAASELVIKPRERSSRVHEATAVLLYSDLHPEEVVDRQTVSGLNEFDPVIARERNTQLARAVLWNLDAMRSERPRAGYRIRDFVLAILGDLISNSIHPELMEGNAMGPADALVFVEELVRTMIDTLLSDQELKRIWIPCCHGNHDRMTPKIRHATKAANSLAWILYHHLAARYADEPRVRFDVARGNMVYTSIYGRDFRWTHGDDVRYYGGVLGVGVPFQKAIDAWNRSRTAYLTCCGHFHQFAEHREYVMNGSLIGYTPYAQAIKARWEPASQAFFLIDKDYGKGWVKAIQLQGKGSW